MLNKILTIPVKEVALKTINYKTIDANSPVFGDLSRDLSLRFMKKILQANESPIYLSDDF